MSEGEIWKLNNDKTDGSIVLFVQDGKPILPENTRGKITWGSCRVELHGVRRGKPLAASANNRLEDLSPLQADDPTDWVASFWIIEDIVEDSEQWLDPESNGFGATSVLDDQGHPFLFFNWAMAGIGGGGDTAWSGYFLGKKVVGSLEEGDSKRWMLSREEKIRLGIGLTEFQLDQWVNDGILDTSEVHEAGVVAVEEAGDWDTDDEHGDDFEEGDSRELDGGLSDEDAFEETQEGENGEIHYEEDAEDAEDDEDDIEEISPETLEGNKRKQDILDGDVMPLKRRRTDEE